MGQRAVTAQKPFTMIVGALKQGSDPSLGSSGNPVVALSTYTRQSFPEIPGRGPNCTYPGIKGTTTRTGLLTGSSTAATGSITVNGTTAILGVTTIHLGEYTLTSGVEFTVDPASGANTATSLATAIAKLDGYGATPAGAVVNITGPVGVLGNEVSFRAGGVSPYLFVFSPVNGSMGSAQPTIGPPTIT
tara:strand:+ start:1272 stop:1838 length:567 start_codon:yes stop_codon:yes gene_type:complete